MRIEIAFALMMFLSGAASADVIVTDPSQEIEKAKTPEESPDSSPSSPPLETDDPGTPGRNGIEVNFIGSYDTYRIGNTRSAGIDANYGVGERGQIRVQQNYFEDHLSGQRTFKGNDDTSAGFKYRFYDDNVLKLALYPSYQFDDETKRVGVDGTKADSDGRSFYMPLIAAQQIGLVTIVGNAGYAFNFDDHHRYSAFTSLAAGWAVAETTRIEGEIASTKSEEGRMTNLRLGFVQEIFPNEKSRFETAVFGSIARSVGATEDGLTHMIYLIGVTVARKADEAK